MSATPMQVLTRPFAIEPVTNIMLPDGIFDNAIYNLQIACHFTNSCWGEPPFVSVRQGCFQWLVVSRDIPEKGLYSYLSF